MNKCFFKCILIFHSSLNLIIVFPPEKYFTWFGEGIQFSRIEILLEHEWFSLKRWKRLVGSVKSRFTFIVFMKIFIQNILHLDFSIQTNCLSVHLTQKWIIYIFKSIGTTYTLRFSNSNAFLLIFHIHSFPFQFLSSENSFYVDGIFLFV